MPSRVEWPLVTCWWQVWQRPSLCLALVQLSAQLGQRAARHAQYKVGAAHRSIAGGSSTRCGVLLAFFFDGMLSVAASGQRSQQSKHLMRVSLWKRPCLTQHNFKVKWGRCGHCCAAAMTERPNQNMPRSAAQQKMRFSIIKVSRQAVCFVLLDFPRILNFDGR